MVQEYHYGGDAVTNILAGCVWKPLEDSCLLLVKRSTSPLNCLRKSSQDKTIIVMSYELALWWML